MNEEIKARWVAALRSGKYEQGGRRLHWSTEGGDSFCCLGVLCDLAYQEGVVSREKDARYPAVNYDGEGGGLPTSVVEWAGMSHPYGQVENNSLSHLNDEDRLSFDEIADLIERSNTL